MKRTVVVISDPSLKPVVRICKEFDFDAAHSLPDMPKGHKCRRMHGHTYRVKVWAKSVIDDRTGLVVDYSRLRDPVHKALDHRCLNDIPGLEKPTTEVLAVWILNRLRKAVGPWCEVERVRVYESSTTYCEVPADV